MTLGNGDGQPVNTVSHGNLSETRCYIAIESSVELCNRMLFLSKLSQKGKKKGSGWLHEELFGPFFFNILKLFIFNWKVITL